MKITDTTPEQVLKGHSPKVRALVNRLRSLVRNTIPEAEERAYPVWHGIGYRHPKAGYLCLIAPLEDCVKMYFEHGRLLADPAGLFTKTGTQTGQILFKTTRDIKKRVLQLLLHESVEFGLEKKARKSR